MSQEMKLGPWPDGIDNVHRPNAVRVDQYGNPQAVVDALNVDFDPTGFPGSRGGQRLAIAISGAHSIATISAGTYFVAGGLVYKLFTGNGFAATQVGALNSDEPASFDDYLGGVVVSNRSSLIKIMDTYSGVLSIPDAQSPIVIPQAIGGLKAGNYGVAIANVRGGTEGALSDMQVVSVVEGGGIQVRIPPISGVDTVFVFRTDTNGMVMFHTDEAAPGSTIVLGSSTDLGKEPEFRFKRAMVSGDFVNFWRSRLLVAIGRNMYFSEPYGHHVTDRRQNFVQFPRKINFIRAVQEGVFVGTKEDVFFLPGTDPKAWKMVSTGGQPAASRGAILVDGSDLDPAYKLTGQNIAVWLSTSGFVYGTPDGGIIEPQAERFKNALPQQASIAYNDRRLTAVVT